MVPGSVPVWKAEHELAVSRFIFDISIGAVG